MPPIPQRIAATFAVLRGRYGDATALARDREQSRQAHPGFRAVLSE